MRRRWLLAVTVLVLAAYPRFIGWDKAVGVAVAVLVGLGVLAA